MLLVDGCSRDRSKKRGESFLTPPFVHYSRMLNLELISPVQIAVCPASTTPNSTILINPEVLLYRSREFEASYHSTLPPMLIRGAMKYHRSHSLIM